MRIHLRNKWSLILTFLFLCQSAFADSFHLLTASDESRQPSAAGGSDSYSPILTPDGRVVLFTSAAENLCLTTNNTAAVVSSQGALNVFVRDSTNGTTSLISANINGTGGGNANSIAAGISTNGHFALFESSASDLILNDTNNVKDIFVRNLTNEVTVCVSVSTNGGNANGASWDAVFTPDGRYVAFVSAADNLVWDDTNGIPDVFVRDLELNTTVLASPGAMSVTVASASEMPQISDDGRFVAFHSTATNLVADVGTSGEIYLRDLLEGTTIFASTDASMLSTNAFSFNHVISANGRFVAFQVRGNPGTKTILRYDRETGLTDLIHTNICVPNTSPAFVRNLSMTPDGRFIAFIANAGAGSCVNTYIQVWDADTATTTLVSGDTNGVVPVDSTCDWPTIDATGRFVSFVSSAPGLVTNVLSGLYHVYRRDILLETTTLINVDTNGTGSEVIPTGIPQISEGGRFVAFEAFDGGFVAGDNNRAYDVFLRDVVNGTTELISASSPQLPSFAGAGSSIMSAPSVSSSGRYIAFDSSADDLVGNDANGKRDIFVRDTFDGATTLVSVNTNGFSANGMCLDPSISGDGRYVAFVSTASDLAPKGADKVWNVFVRDMQSPGVALASVSTIGTSGGNNDSFGPQISADARHLLFRSRASNLATIQSGTNLFLRVLESSTTVALTTAGVSDASMTPDGKYVAFIGNIGSGNLLYIWDSEASARVYTNFNLENVRVAISPDGDYLAYVRNSQLNALNWRTGSNWLVGPITRPIQTGLRFSGDGQFLTFATTNMQSVVNDTNGTFDTFLFDLQAGTKTHISRSHDTSEAGDAASDVPAISFDGRFVAYRSTASNIIPGVSNLWPNIILYDRLAGTNKLLSSGGNNWLLPPVFSGDGRSLVFASSASGLSTTDFNRGTDVFGFAFLYATITPGTGGDGPTISWTVMPGENYQVQFKNSLDDAIWQVLNGDIVVSGSHAFIEDASPANDQKIYRVLAF
ncbi:MAG: hypothetical protein H0X66_00240 [Verrucomicrobia bacterium]|nr:hypothetical protein [Verrucomicrobiota bacterium]